MATTTVELLERFAQRECDLLGVPPACQTFTNGLAAVHFDSEAFETERARAIVTPLGLVGTETVTRLAFAAPGAGKTARVVPLVAPPARLARPRPPQGKLLIAFYVPSRLSHVVLLPYRYPRRRPSIPSMEPVYEGDVTGKVTLGLPAEAAKQRRRGFGIRDPGERSVRL